MIRYLKDSLPRGNSAGDCLDALVVGTDMMEAHIGTKKYDRKIFILTDADSPINDDGLDEIIRHIQKCNASIDIIGLDFDSEKFKQQGKSQTKAKNEKLLEDIAEKVGGRVFPISEALSLLSHFKSKRVRSTTSFRGEISVGSNRIPILAWTKTTEIKLPSAKKESKLSVDSETKEVERIMSYQKADGDYVERKDLVKAYRYGRSLIPFHTVDEAQMGFKSERAIDVLGFAPKSKVYRESFMGNVSVIAADPDYVGSQGQLSAYIHALYEKDAVALAKYVRVKNANPKLIVMYPVIKADKEFLYFSQLPFAEDIRRFTFPSLSKIKPTDKQLNLMENWINSMDLMEAALDDDGDKIEAFKPKNTFNPTYQRLFQCIRERALDSEALIPPIDPHIQQHVEPIPHVLKNSREEFRELIDSFELEKVEVEEVKKAWKVDEEDLEALLGLKEKVEKNLSDEVDQIGTLHPISDFRKMCDRKDQDLVPKAILELGQIIVNLVSSSFGEQNYEKALNCLNAMREICIRENEALKFNEFMNTLKQNYAQSEKRKGFWELVKIGLIQKSESSEGCSEAEAVNFWTISQ